MGNCSFLTVPCSLLVEFLREGEKEEVIANILTLTSPQPALRDHIYLRFFCHPSWKRVFPAS